MQLLGSIICVTSLSVVLRFTCTLDSLLCGSFMIPMLRPFCKMGTSIKRRGKVWISGEFTRNKRCDMIYMLSGMCRGEGQEIRKENRGSKPASSVFLNIRIAFAQHCRAGGLPLPRISPTAEFTSSEGRCVCRFLPGGKGIFRLRRKIPAGASPPPYGCWLKSISNFTFFAPAAPTPAART